MARADLAVGSGIPDRESIDRCHQDDSGKACRLSLQPRSPEKYPCSPRVSSTPALAGAPLPVSKTTSTRVQRGAHTRKCTPPLASTSAPTGTLLGAAIGPCSPTASTTAALFFMTGATQVATVMPCRCRLNRSGKCNEPNCHVANVGQNQFQCPIGGINRQKLIRGRGFLMSDGLTELRHLIAQFEDGRAYFVGACRQEIINVSRALTAQPAN